MICKNCGKDNEASSKFCSDCGNELEELNDFIKLEPLEIKKQSEQDENINKTQLGVTKESVNKPSHRVRFFNLYISISLLVIIALLSAIVFVVASSDFGTLRFNKKNTVKVNDVNTDNRYIGGEENETEQNPDNIKPAHTHSLTEWDVVRDVTCTEDGAETRTCRECEFVESRPIPATGQHSFGDWSVTENATCIKNGTEQRKCSVCDYTESKTLPMSPDHSYGTWKTIKQSTCYENGLQTRTCSECGHEETKTLGKGNHQYSAWQVSGMASCVSPKVETRRCTICGFTDKRETGEPGMHIYVPGSKICPVCNQQIIF